MCSDGYRKLAICAPAVENYAGRLKLHHPFWTAPFAEFGSNSRAFFLSAVEKVSLIKNMFLLTLWYTLHNKSRLLLKSRFVYNKDNGSRKAGDKE